MKSLIIAKSNIRKNISATVTLIFLIIVSTILMYIGSNVLLNVSSILDKKNEAINGADFWVMSPEFYEKEVEKTLKGMEGYVDLESSPLIPWETTKVKNITMDDKEQTIPVIFLNADKNTEMSSLKIVEEGSEKKDNSIVMPYYLKVSCGYQVGDIIRIEDDDQTFEFEVYGFLEDVLFATPMNYSCYKCYVFDEQYKFLEGKLSEAGKFSGSNVRIKSEVRSDDFDDAFVREVAENEKLAGARILGLNYASMKTGASATNNIFMSLIIVFGVIILSISLVIIRFTIVTHIEENIKNIGALESMGYTNKQLIMALLIQFMMIAVIGVTAGIVISVLANGVISQFVSSILAFKCTLAISALAIGLCYLVIILLVGLITLRAGNRMKLITPINAMRNGIETHNFKKNYFPLSKTSLPLAPTIAFKTMISNKKQTVSIAMISTIIAFAFMCLYSLCDNFVVRDMPFVNLIGMEKSDVKVTAEESDLESIAEECLEVKGIRKAVRYNGDNLTIKNRENESSTIFNICEDFSKIDVNTIIEGRYPIHENEITLSLVLKNRLDTSVGDYVSISTENITKEYLVVGIVQHINNLGRSASLTEEGIKKVKPDYKPTSLYLYLDKENDALEIENVIQQVKDRIKENHYDDAVVTNMQEYFSLLTDNMKMLIGVMCVFFLVLMCGINIIVLYFLLKVKLVKDKTSAGINKALGFTTNQLVTHNLYGFVPIIFVSSIVGSILGYFFVDPMFTLSLSMFGIKNGVLDMQISYNIVTIFFITLIAFVTTLLVSLRIRKLNPIEIINSN